MEKKENEEYKKRIRKLIENVEKNKDKDSPKTEQDVIEAKKRLLETAKSKIHPYFRSERILLVFAYTIRDYYKRKADSIEEIEKYKIQQEIDHLFDWIYKELRKQNPLISNSDPKYKKKMEKLDRKRLLKNITGVVGYDNMYKDFYKHYEKRDIFTLNSYTREMIGCFLSLGFLVLVLILIFLGFDFLPY